MPSPAGTPLPTCQRSDLSHDERMWADDEVSPGLGMEILTLGRDQARVRMTITPAMVHGHGIAHGGFLGCELAN